MSQELPAGQGTYRIRMIPYQDAQFTSPFDGEVEIQVNQQMYVAVEVEGVDRNQITSVLDNCWATPVNDAEYHVRWNLIINEWVTWCLNGYMIKFVTISESKFNKIGWHFKNKWSIINR